MKTGLVANLLVSTIFATAYLLSVPIITSFLDVSEPYRILYFVFAIQILELYALGAFQAIVLAKEPQMLGFGLLVHEFTKVFLAFAFVIVLHKGLFGILAAFLIAHFVQTIFFFVIARDCLKEKVE